MIRNLLVIFFAILPFVCFSEEHVAGIKGNCNWSRYEDASLSGFGVSFKNDSEPSIGVQVIAFNDGHFDIDSSPLGQYWTGAGTVLIEDVILSTVYIGGVKYENVPYIKRKAKMQGVFTNIEVWQVTKDNIEYSIIGISPVKKNLMLTNFVSKNLTLLPLPTISEDSFISTVEAVNSIMNKAGGAKMSDEVMMVSAVVDKEHKEFIRTYKFYPEISTEDVDLLTTNDATYSMVEYEVENTPLVKNAVALGYSLVVVWTDKNGEFIISYKYNF